MRLVFEQDLSGRRISHLTCSPAVSRFPRPSRICTFAHNIVKAYELSVVCPRWKATSDLPTLHYVGARAALDTCYLPVVSRKSRIGTMRATSIHLYQRTEGAERYRAFISSKPTIVGSALLVYAIIFPLEIFLGHAHGDGFSIIVGTYHELWAKLASLPLSISHVHEDR